MIKEKISIYIILYYDLDFLDDILNNIINDVDEIILVDGPYKYCIPFLTKLNLLYDELNKPQELTNIINKYNTKIKYYYNVWENEKEKRMFGYEKCTNNIVLLVDCDEFIIFNVDFINNFINSNKSVSGFEINNMNRININFDKLCKKYIIFKKNNITAHQHLSYTWLIGVDGLEKNIQSNYYFNHSMGTIYHQTLNRTKKNNIIKYIFYTRLHELRNGNIDSFLGYNLDIVLNILDIDNILNIFYHSSIELIGIPNNKILFHNNNVLLNLSKYSNNHIEGYFTPNTKMLTNINYCCYIDLPNNNNIIKILFRNVKSVNIKLYEICLNKEYDIHNYDFNNGDDEINIDINLINNNCISFILCINTNYTKNNDNIYEINNIII